MAKPLTKRRKDGRLYARRASVEEAIDVAKTQDLETLRSQLQIGPPAAAALPPAQKVRRPSLPRVAHDHPRRRCARILR